MFQFTLSGVACTVGFTRAAREPVHNKGCDRSMETHGPDIDIFRNYAV
jgi:hypothetical protein